MRYPQQLCFDGDKAVVHPCDDDWCVQETHNETTEEAKRVIRPNETVDNQVPCLTRDRSDECERDKRREQEREEWRKKNIE